MALREGGIGSEQIATFLKTACPQLLIHTDCGSPHRTYFDKLRDHIKRTLDNFQKKPIY